MRHTRPLFAISASMFAAVALSGGTAHAARSSQPDRPGDVVGTTQGPPSTDDGQADCDEPTTPAGATGVPNVDLTRLTTIDARRTVTVTIAFADLDAGRLSLEVPLLTPRDDYTVDIDRQGGRTYTDWEPHFQSDVAQAEAEAHAQGQCGFYVTTTGGGCRGLRSDIDQGADRVTVSIPRTCMRSPAWVRVGAQATRFRHDRPDVETIFEDHWTPYGRPSARFPAYGPRVRPPH